MKIISLGWGVQSWTMAAMSALGYLPKVDFAIHSDTTWERQSTYEFAEKWTPWLEDRGVKVITVSDPVQPSKVASSDTDIPAFTLKAGAAADEWNGVFIPAFTLTDNSRGQLRRQCTQRWKIVPMRRWVAEELKRRGITKTPGVVEQWLGITLDEWQRAKDSDVAYVVHRFPLLDLRMTRADCLAWLDDHNLPSPGKSACVFCPYQNRHKWQELKRNNGADWQTAKEVDEMLRDKRPPYPLFVHPARKPLDEAVVIPEDFDAQQLSLLDQLEPDDKDAECDSGYCFL